MLPLVIISSLVTKHAKILRILLYKLVESAFATIRMEVRRQINCLSQNVEVEGDLELNGKTLYTKHVGIPREVSIGVVRYIMLN